MGFLARVHSGDLVRRTWAGPASMSDHDIIQKLSGFGRPKTLSGVPVDEATAYTFSAVYDAVNQLSSDLAKVPLIHKKRLANGGAEDYTTSKVYKLLKYAPNPEQNPFVFRRTLMAYALTWHGAFAEIVRDGTGTPAALWILEPWRVRVTRENGVLQYRVKNATGVDTFMAPRDVLHLQGLGDGYNSYPLIQLARQAIGLALAAEAFGATFFGNGLQFGGILTSDANWDEETAKRAKDVLESMYVGPDAAHQIVALWGGLKLQTTGVDPQKAQMNDLRNQQIQEVARFFNMPLHKLKLAIPGAVSYASVEMADLDYYKGPILTWGKQIEDECNLKLISPLEQTQQFIKHNFNAFLRGDIKSRYDALGIARDKGIINANEWRELEDMNPQDGEQGDLYLVQTAQTPLDLLVDLTQSQIDKNNAPPPAPVPTSNDASPAADAAMRALIERLERAEAAVREQQTIAETAQAALNEAMADRATLQAERDDLKVAAETAQATHGQLDAIRAGLEVEVAQAREALAREAAARVESEQQAEALRVASDGALAIRDASVQLAERAADALRAELAAALGKFAAAREAQDVTLKAVQDQADEAAKDAARLAVEVSGLQVERTMLAASATDAYNARKAAEQALKDANEAEDQADLVVASALRMVIAKTIARKVRHECERLRRAQASPAKLQTAIRLFYDAHTAELAEALIDPVRAYVLWAKADVDPAALVDTIAREAVAASKRDLDEVVATDPVEDFSAALEMRLQQWERDRPDALADQVVRSAPRRRKGAAL